VDWAALNEKLRGYVDSVSSEWKEWVKNETYGWLNEGLRPRAITRDIEWGVPIPIDRIPEDKLVTNPDKKRIYVWFDAVIGYYSASLAWADTKNGDWERFWFDDKTDKKLKHYYYMGKDNLVFHTMFWPGQLMTFNSKLHLPDVVSINMFLDFGGKQFSKSRGVTIPIDKFIEEFGNDATRFYLTLIMPETRDSSFKWDDFEEKVNGILVANLGNFVHRVLSIGKKTDSEDLEEIDIWEEVSNRAVLAFERSVKHLEKSEFRAYLNEILELSAFGNSIVDREKLWELKKTDEDKFNDVLKQLYFVIVALKYLMNPLLPHGSERLAKMTSTEIPSKWELEDLTGVFSSEADSIELNDLKPLFEKLEGVSKRGE
jgi:methionyl-tRNA synthetase